MSLTSSGKKYLFLIPVVLTAGMFFSCENDLREVERVTLTKDAPQETMEGVVLTYSDSGVTKAILETPLIQKFLSEEKSAMEFPKGLKVTFFNPFPVKESQLTSRYGILDQQQKMLTVRNNVVFINFINEDTLNTELLNWRQDSAKVYTDKKVILRGKKGNFWAKGLVANETFSWYEFKQVEGLYFYNREEVSDQD